ncbi:uncharacterized protein [Arachis hypogaea]|uniref:uncharacterized protein n=1 Tax=Arachis hypogaea TaxID=3818 RepID=UPI003B21458C
MNGVTYDTFHEACSAMGFLIDDKEYVSAIKEVVELASAAQLRRLFVILLLFVSIGIPLSVWEKTWAYLSDDILYHRRHELQYPARLRSEKKIVINIAFSGIASLLLPGGKTAHSMFNIPVELTEDTVCRIKKDSPKAKVVRLADLIFWDEAPMTNKLAFEALNRTLRDIMVSVSDRNKDLPFGGKVVVLGGDFRQVLLVIPKGSRAEIVMASINSSILWKYCEVLRLTKNMRLASGLEQSTAQELRSFSDWILQIGEGRCGTLVNDKLFVDIPSDLIISILENPMEDIANTIYPNLVKNFRDPRFFQDRAILATTIENVEEINNYIVDLLPGEEKNYLSTDLICGSDANSDVDVDWINVEFLNQIRCSSLPNHSLKLKIGVPIILLRNIDPAGSLCNGTRLVV